MSNDTMLYYAADTVGIPLHLMENRYRGAKSGVMKIGPMEVPYEMVVAEDALNRDEGGFFVRFAGRLWGYLTIYKNGTQDLYFFDGDVAELKVKDITKFGGASPKATLAKLQSAITATYHFANNKWNRVNAEDLDKDRTK